MNAEQDLIDQLYKLQEENSKLKSDKAELLEALKVIKEEASQNDYRGLRTFKLCTDLLYKHK